MHYGGSGAPEGKGYQFTGGFSIPDSGDYFDKPILSFTRPYQDIAVNNNYFIAWDASAAIDGAAISLYYDKDNSGNDGTLLAEDLVAGTDAMYFWDTSALAGGTYHLYAAISQPLSRPSTSMLMLSSLLTASYRAT